MKERTYVTQINDVVTGTNAAGDCKEWRTPVEITVYLEEETVQLGRDGSQVIAGRQTYFVDGEEMRDVKITSYIHGLPEHRAREANEHSQCRGTLVDVDVAKVGSWDDSDVPDRDDGFEAWMQERWDG